QRALRPDRPQGRELRRRLWIELPLAHHRPEKGARDLVPLPAVRRAPGARDGPREHGRAAREPRAGDGQVVPRDPAAQPDRDPLAQGRAQRRLRWASRPPAARGRRDAPLLPDRRGQGREERLPREAKAKLQEVPAPALTMDTTTIEPGSARAW